MCAVSYLNTVPLVWGFQHDPKLRDIFDLSFALPSVCAAQMASGQADIGILPVIETARQGLEYFRGTGIACHGAVRTILLITKVAFADIKTLAVDSGSRTSVMLSRVILAERYGANPTVFEHVADLDTMLQKADAALIIGDPALHIDLETLKYEYLDLGAEWFNMTGLPMVFAVWSARKDFINDAYAETFQASCRYGLEHMDDIVRQESPIRKVSPELTRSYLTKHIVFELTDRDYQGMRHYLDLAMR
ncbi:MAG: menaquinone biosynthesis protein [Acidobacteriota bacterium]